MLLPADFKTALQTVFGVAQRRRSIAASHMDWRQHKALGGQCILHREHGGQGRDLQLDRTRGAACLHDGFGDDQADHLADELHGIDGEHRLVMREGGEDLVAGNVLGEHHIAHAGHGERGACVHAVERAVRDGRENRRGVQRALDFGDVVDVGDGSRHLRAGTFMRVRCADCGLGGFDVGCAGVHADASSGCSVASVGWPWLLAEVSSQKRWNNAPSISRR